MDSTIKWKNFCEQICNNRFSSEAEFESALSMAFSFLLGWKTDRQESFAIGNRKQMRPDILLKNADGTKIVVEVKSRDVSVSSDEYSQLSSYLKQTQVKFGLLIGKYITIMYNALTEEPIKLVDIEIKADNIDGEELFSCIDNMDNGFMDERFEQLCTKFKGRLKIKDEAREIIRRLTGDNGVAILAEALKNSPDLKDFNSRSIDEATKDLRIIENRPANIFDSKNTHTGINNTYTGMKSINLLDQGMDPTRTRVSALIIDGEKYIVKDWIGVTVHILEKVYHKCGAAILESVGPSVARAMPNENPWPYTKSARPKSIGDSGFVVNAHGSAKALYDNIIFRAIRLANFRQVECEIYNQ